MKAYYRVWADIDLDAIRGNVAAVKEKVKAGTKIFAVIKADGYGHGAIPIAKVIDDITDEYGVAILEEGVALRRAGIKKPVLILGYTAKQQYAEMIKYDIMTTVFHFDMAKEISEEACRQGKTAKIHLALDTGMTRIGFQLKEESIEEIRRIASLPNLEIAGCFTHFAKADEEDASFTRIQFQRYMEFVKRLENEGVTIPLCHVANSAAIMEFPEMQLDMVRSGIVTYGLYPSEEVKKEHLALKPAMSIRTHVSHVKEVEKGVGISYGSTYVTSKKTMVATIPVGYADGYPRALSNTGRVLIHGQSAPILGRVCMDQFMVDVTGIDGVHPGDLVTLVGNDQAETISVEELSGQAHSFNYEFVCDVGKRVPRIYHYQNRVVGTMDYYDADGKDLSLEL